MEFSKWQRERQVGKWGEERFFGADTVRVLSEREVGMRWIVFALHFQSGEESFFSFFGSKGGPAG